MHAPALPFKNKRLRSQVTTYVSTFVSTCDQFRFSWMSGPNHTPRMRIGPSLQRKGPGRWTPPLQAPSRGPSLLSKLTLTPTTSSYFTTTFFTALMSEQRDKKLWYHGRKRPTRGIPIRVEFAFSSQPTEHGLQGKDVETGGNPARSMAQLPWGRPASMHHGLRTPQQAVFATSRFCNQPFSPPDV